MPQQKLFAFALLLAASLLAWPGWAQMQPIAANGVEGPAAPPTLPLLDNALLPTLVPGELPVIASTHPRPEPAPMPLPPKGPGEALESEPFAPPLLPPTVSPAVGPILPAAVIEDCAPERDSRIELTGATGNPGAGGRLPAPGDFPTETMSTSAGSALVVTVTGPATVTPGQAAVYQILVRNMGTTTLGGVRIEQPAPEGLRSALTQPSAVLEQKRLVWQLGELEPRSERRIKLELTPTTAQELRIEPSATYTSSAAVRTRVLRQPLSLTQTGPATIDRGSKFTIQVRVANNTATPLHKVMLVDHLPAGLLHPHGDRIETDLGTLAPGESRALPLEVEAAQAGQLVNDINASTQEGQFARSCWIIQVNLAVLRHQVIAPREAAPGTPVDVRLDVHNPTRMPVHKLRLACRPCAELDLIALSEGGAHDPVKRAALWQVDTLQPGQTLTVVARLRGLKPGEWTYQTQVFAEGVAPSESVQGLTIGSIRTTVRGPGVSIP